MSDANVDSSRMQVWKRVSVETDHICIDLRQLDSNEKEQIKDIVSYIIRSYLLRMCSRNFKRASKHRIYFGYEIDRFGQNLLPILYHALLLYAVQTFAADVASESDIEAIYKELPCHGMIILKKDSQKPDVFQLYFYRRNIPLTGDELKTQLKLSHNIDVRYEVAQKSLPIMLKAILMYPVAHFTKGTGKIISTDLFNEGSADETSLFVKVVDKFRRKKELNLYEKLMHEEEDEEEDDY